MVKLKLILLLIFAVLAGAVLPIQAGMGITLGQFAKNPIFGAFASFIVGAVFLAIILIISRFDFSLVLHSKEIRSIHWLAGVLAAFYVCTVFLIAPRLGTALTFALVVLGQMIVSLILDHYGSFNLPINPINWKRLLGVVLLVSGVILIRRF